MAPHPGEVFILVASLYLATASLLGYSFVAPSSGFWFITHVPYPPLLDRHTLLSASVATPRKCFWWFYFRHSANSLAFTFLTSLIIYIPKSQIFIRMSTSILNSLVQNRDHCLFMSVSFLCPLCLLDTFYSIQVNKDGACPFASLPPPLVPKSFPSSSVKLLSLLRLSSLPGLFQQSFPLASRHTPPSCFPRLLPIHYPVSFL